LAGRCPFLLDLLILRQRRFGALKIERRGRCRPNSGTRRRRRQRKHSMPDPRDQAEHEEALKRFGGKMPEGDTGRTSDFHADGTHRSKRYEIIRRYRERYPEKFKAKQRAAQKRRRQRIRDAKRRGQEGT
jgi:hypothetical protein